MTNYKPIKDFTLMDTVKEWAKGIAIAYVALGSLYYHTVPTTGHRSADVALGKLPPTKLEMAVTEFIADKAGIDLSTDTCMNKYMKKK